MRIQSNHNCMLCSESKDCYMFTEFENVFATCDDCLKKLLYNRTSYQELEGTCQINDKHGMVRKVNDFENNFFFTDLLISDETIIHMKELVDNHKE